MKKNIIYSLALFIAALLIFSSCKKVLDTQPFNKISEDVVWSSKANAETFIFSTYSAIMYDFASGPKTDPYTTNTLGFDDIYNGASSVFTGTLDRNSDFGLQRR